MGNKVSFVFIAKNAYSKIAAKINRDTAKLTKRFKGFRRESKKTASTFKSSTSSMGASIRRMGTAFLGFVGFRKFINEGRGVQDALADLSAITGATGDDLKNLNTDVIRLSRSSIIAQDQVALAFTQIASAKSELLKDPKALAVVTEQVLLLANAAGIQVPDAMRASVGALNQFGKGADQAARFVNVMAAGAKVGASLVFQTADALRDSGFAASSAGLSFEETNALIQVLAKSELKGARAGVALRNIFTILGSVAGGRFDPKIIGITESLEAFGKMNLSTAQMTKIFGRESKDAAGFLIKNTALIKQWTREITGTNEAQRQAAVRLDTFTKKSEKLGIIVDGILIKTFLKLEPILSRQAVSMGDFIDSIEPRNIKAWIDMFKILLQTLSIIGSVLSVILTVITTIDKVATSVFNGIGKLIGESAGAWVQMLSTFKIPTGAFTPLKEAFSVDGKFLGLFDQSPIKQGAIDVNQSSRADVNINLRAPENTVQAIKTKTTGKTSGLNIGVNMAVAQ